jgi:hypothetical protein
MDNIEYINQDCSQLANKHFQEGNYEMACHYYSIVLKDANNYNGDDMSVIMFAASASDRYQECLNILDNQKKLELNTETEEKISQIIIHTNENFLLKILKKLLRCS